MKKLRYATGDFFSVIVICAIIAICGFSFYQNKTLKDDLAYSYTEENTGNEEGAILDAAVKDANIDSDVIFIPVEKETLKNTSYTLEQVYDSIYDLKGKKETDIEEELNDIYQNFYDYFKTDNEFVNVYGEEYTYDEYMFVRTYHVMRNNKEKFGFYLAAYSKCDNFELLTNHSRQDKLEEYCN